MNVRTENVIGLVLRQSIRKNVKQMLYALGIDGTWLSDADKLAEIMRACLFDKSERPNPGIGFAKRAKAGDFDGLREGEDAEALYVGDARALGLPKGRLPMDAKTYQAVLADAELLSAYWSGRPTATAMDIVSRIVLLSDVDSDGVAQSVSDA